MDTEKIFSYNSEGLTFTRRITHSSSRASFSEHAHAQLEIVLCNRGTHAYLVEGRRILLEQGMMIAVAPGISHRVIMESDDYDRFSVIIHPSLLPEGAIERLGRGATVLKLSSDDEICTLLKKGERYYTELPSDTHHLIFHALATELYYMLLARAPEEKPTASDIINRAVAYIDEHFAEIKSMSDVCDNLYLSKSYFHSLFREHIKKTPHEYLVERRLYFANLKILSGERPTKVFRECGFYDYTSFYRAYKKLYGHAPSRLSRSGFSENEF